MEISCLRLLLPWPVTYTFDLFDSGTVGSWTSVASLSVAVRQAVHPSRDCRGPIGLGCPGGQNRRV
jgi:hypothetical protein